MNEIDQIDLHRYTAKELRELNARIIERLKYLSSVKTMKSMSKLNLGQRVCFDTDEETITGTLIKLNQKTVIIATDDAMQWKVSPQLVRPVLEEQSGNVTQIKQHKP